MQTQEITLVIAAPKDLELVLAIWSECAEWMKREKGVHGQWPDRFPEHAATTAINVSELFLVYVDNQCVGTVRIQESDETVWGPDGGRSLYIHSLAVRRSHAGRGLSGFILDYIQCDGHMRGRPHLRLDCLASNTSLSRFYERLGFVCRGEVDQDNGYRSWKASLYER